MKKSKYLNQKFAGWTCTKVNVYRVQPVFLKGSKELSARPHHQTYSYTLEGNLLGKRVRITVNAKEAAKMYRGKFDPTSKLLKDSTDVSIVL